MINSIYFETERMIVRAWQPEDITGLYKEGNWGLPVAFFVLDFTLLLIKMCLKSHFY